MQVLPKKKASLGIIQLPFLLAAGVIIGAVLLTSSFSKKETAKVLSESNGEGSAQEVQTRTSEASENKDRSPETEIKDSEPTETPEVEDEESEEEFEVKDGTKEAKIKIKSAKNKFEFQQEGAKIQIESDFPLSVNPLTRELTVTTPAGSRVVAILPQQAIDNMLSSGVLSETTGVDLKTEDDGSVSYSVDGTKNEKLLGVFEVSVPKTIIVSADTGNIVVVNQSVFSKILDLLSV